MGRIALVIMCVLGTLANRGDSMFRLRTSILLYFAIVCFGAPNEAHSIALLQLSGTCGASALAASDGCTDGAVQSPTAVSRNSSASAAWPDDGFNGAASASASYATAADYGRLGVRITASASSSIPSVNPAGTATQAEGFGTASAAFLDTLTLVGTPTGSDAVINFSIPIDGQFARSATHGTTGGFVVVGFVLAGVGGCWTPTPTLGCQTGPIQGSFNVTIGLPFDVIVDFQINSIAAISNGAFVDGSWQAGSANVDAAFDQTLLSFFDPQDPTLRLVSLSGHDYATPTSVAVSEPASMALVLPGLLLVGIWGGSRSVHNSGRMCHAAARC